MVSRTLIAGVPQSGKTTYALKEFPESIITHTDDLLATVTVWSERSEKIVELMDKERQFCIEGCDAVRGLRKFMVRNPGKKPVDHVIWFGAPKVELSNKQAAFGRGCKKIFDELMPDLHTLGVLVTIES